MTSRVCIQGACEAGGGRQGTARPGAALGQEKAANGSKEEEEDTDDEEAELAKLHAQKMALMER